MVKITCMQVATEVMYVNSEASIVTAREMVKKIAASIGFDVYDQYRIATAVSELAENAVKYAGGGTIEFHPIKRGLEIICKDSGRGMMQKNTGHGLGIGLKSIEHLMDEMTITTEEHGTRILARKWLK
ncbi:MAG: ATP-binding protein [Methanosarcinales archaeon]|uniref:ATP-binding protein n=1 Tax=Candidatus Ethanoperedens thermophilum TaxID=2766897 RepID=A0A848DAZ6_9EURY|nr:ATP-binding protein [Candidatus Ethanoperedens thermophilum]